MNIKILFSRFLGLFPTRLPQGLTEFNTWKDSIVKTYSPPGDDRSIQFVLSSLLMRLGPTEDFKAKNYFAKSLFATASKQVAVHVQEEIKVAQRAEYEAAQLAAKEATPSVETQPS